MHDLLRDSPFYQEILQEGREEGKEEGLEQGRLQGLRQALLNVVQARFPKAIRLAKVQAAMIDDPEAVESLIFKMSMAQSLEEARKYLLEVGEDNNN